MCKTQKEDEKINAFKFLTFAVVIATISSLAVYSAVGSAGVASASTATVTVNATNAIKAVDSRIYGVNTAAWDELIYQNGVIDENYLQTVKDSGIKFIVYPGGAWSNDFVWNDPALPTMQNFDQFIAFCQAVGAEPKVDVNVKGSVDLATSWVQYSKDKGYNVTYWQLADEPWYNGLRGSAYSAKINEFAPAMKAVDPTIKIVADVSCRYNSERGNTNTVVKNSWQNIDVYNHNLYFIDPKSYSYDQRQAYYDDLLHNTTSYGGNNSVRTWLSFLENIVNTYKDPAKPVEYTTGSYNSISYYPADWQINYLPQGLWEADLLGTLIEENVTHAGYWAMQNPYPIKQSSYGYVSPDFRPYVAYYAMQLYTYFFGDTLVSSTSSTQDLAVYASTSTNKLSLILINKDPVNDITTTFNLQNWTPQSTARAWILDGPTEPDNLPGRVLGYGLRTEDITGVSSQFTWTVPSYSAVAIELPNAQGSLSTGIPPNGEVRENTPPYTPSPGSPNLALGKTATASTTALSTMPIDYSIDAFSPQKAVDNDDTWTRWGSKIWWESTDYSDLSEWFQLDLGAPTTFNKIVIKWGLWATSYSISVSNDAQNWTQVATKNNATQIKSPPSPWDQIDLSTQNARYIKLNMTQRPSSMPYGQEGMLCGAFAIWEFEVYNTGGTPSGSMHVSSIDMALASQGPFTYAQATVTVVDEVNAAVPTATVYGHWENATSDSDSGATGSNGQVTLQSDKIRNPPSGTTYTFVVDDIVKDGWTYDPTANVESSDSIIVP